MPPTMRPTLTRALLAFTAILCLSVFVFIGGQVLTLADMAQRIHPMLGQGVFWGGMAAYCAALVWLGAGWFLRPRPLQLPGNPSPEQLRDHASRLAARLRQNPLLRNDRDAPPAAGPGASPSEAAHHPGMPGLPELAQAADMLRRLDAAALRETKRTASRIFLSTAVARNGRLDTLIVLVLLARLVWRISAIYDQRPHPRDMLRLYMNVAGTALAAGALEEAGLEEHIHALLGPLLTASPLASMPGASHVGTLLAAALVDGSANALLALRVGIVTRNMLSPVLPGFPARPNPYRESAAQLGRMTAGLVRAVMKAAVNGVASGIRSGIQGTARRTADAVRKGARATVNGVGGVANLMANRAAHAAGDLAARAMPPRGAGRNAEAPAPPPAPAPAAEPAQPETKPARNRSFNPFRLFRRQ